MRDEIEGSLAKEAADLLNISLLPKKEVGIPLGKILSMMVFTVAINGLLQQFDHICYH